MVPGTRRHSTAIIRNNPKLSAPIRNFRFFLASQTSLEGRNYTFSNHEVDGLILAAVGSRSVGPGRRWKALVTSGNWWFKIFVWFVYVVVDEEWLLRTWNLAFQILRLWSTRDEGFSDLADSAEDTTEVCSS